MAKPMSKKKVKGKKMPKKQPQKKQRLDKAAKDYAKLLADPCYGMITAPLYNSSGTGNFVRLENDFILGAEATSIGAAVIFTPGLLTSSAGPSGTVIPTTVVASDGGAITWAESYANQCGSGFRANMGSCRAVAACIQVSFIGAELNRAGVVSLTQTTRGNAVAATNLGAVRSLSERVVKMPDGTLEIKLVPNAKNAEFMITDATAKTDAAELPSLVVSVSGIPNSTGVRIRQVQIIEWVPFVGVGVISNTLVSDSLHTLQEVLALMHRNNPGWQYELLTGLGAYAAKTLTWI